MFARLDNSCLLINAGLSTPEQETDNIISFAHSLPILNLLRDLRHHGLNIETRNEVNLHEPEEEFLFVVRRLKEISCWMRLRGELEKRFNEDKTSFCCHKVLSIDLDCIIKNTKVLCLAELVSFIPEMIVQLIDDQIEEDI